MRNFTLTEGLRERMNKYVKADGETGSRQTAKKSFARQDSADEDLRKRVRQAVKSVPVPADLESKMLNFIRKKSGV